MKNMSRRIKYICGITRQIVILTGLAVLTFAAGIEWAQAAETGAATASAMPGELHVVFLFLLTLGGLAVITLAPQERAKVRGRPEKQRRARR
jgi:TRAP-type C4-dicarboxylate transport system permease small subunit